MFGRFELFRRLSVSVIDGVSTTTDNIFYITVTTHTHTHVQRVIMRRVYRKKENKYYRPCLKEDVFLGIPNSV